MNHCGLGEGGADFIAQGLKKGTNRTLKTLNLIENNFGDEGVKNFIFLSYADGKQNHRIGTEDQKVSMLSETYLANLNISSNYITDEMGIKIAEQLSKNRYMESLNLSVNTLTEESG